MKMFEIADIIEKPSRGKAPSNLAVSARYVFSPDIFSQIREISDAEQGITAAIQSLLAQGKTVQCVSLADGESRYDIGNHESYYRAFIDYALEDPEYGSDILEYVRAIGGSK